MHSSAKTRRLIVKWIEYIFENHSGEKGASLGGNEFANGNPIKPSANSNLITALTLMILSLSLSLFHSPNYNLLDANQRIK